MPLRRCKDTAYSQFMSDRNVCCSVEMRHPLLSLVFSFFSCGPNNIHDDKKKNTLKSTQQQQLQIPTESNEIQKRKMNNDQ